MKSVKLGRGPSFFNGVGSIIAIIFGIFWTVFTASMEAPDFFIIFGIIFIFAGIIQAIFFFNNATSKNRYSLYDITEDETDPLEKKTKRTKRAKNYCLSCGEKLKKGASFCENCGKKI